MLEVEGLQAGYGKVEVLHGLDFAVQKGRIVTLIGSNGAGKTTTMRALSGMIRPTAGSIKLNGCEIGGLDSFAVARTGLAHSPEGRRVFPSLSVEDNLTLGAFPRLTGSRPKGDVAADRNRAFELFPRLKERRTQLAGTLSGGEQQMLAMGRALMLRPDILLLDEPSMGLAPKLVEEVFRIIRQLKSESVTMLLVEQFAMAALEVADYAYVMENGRIRFEGEAGKAKKRPCDPGSLSRRQPLMVGSGSSTYGATPNGAAAEANDGTGAGGSCGFGSGSALSLRGHRARSGRG